MHDKEQLKWNIFFQKMAHGEIPHHTKFYCIDEYVTDDEVNTAFSKYDIVEPDIKIVVPTQQQVDQTKVVVKHKLEETPRGICLELLYC